MIILWLYCTGLLYTSAALGPITLFPDKDFTPSAIFEDSRTRVWFGTETGNIYRYDKNGWVGYADETGEEEGGNPIEYITEDCCGNIWFGSTTETICYNGEGFSAHRSRIHSIDTNGNVWFSKQSEIVRFDGKSFIRHPFPETFDIETVYCIVHGKDREVWVGTDIGVARFDRTNWKLFTHEKNAPRRPVRSLYVDSHNRVWNRLSVYTNGEWRRYGVRDGIADTTVTSMAEDTKGNIWFGTRWGISVFNGTVWATFTKADGIQDNHILCITPDSNGRVWAGTRYGIGRFDKGRWRFYDEDDGCADEFIEYIVEDKFGRIWAGNRSLDNGISMFNGEEWKAITTDDGLPGNRVIQLYTAPSGDLWFITDSGPAYLNRQTTHTHISRRTQPTSPVFSARFNRGQIQFMFRNVPRDVTVEITTLSGKSVATIDRTGSRTLHYPAHGLTDGIYLCAARSKTFSRSVRITVVR
jgi:ligand-binding sensor domain-containing protein